MGSADLMPRNLDHRIEIVAPIENPRAQTEVNAILDQLLADNAVGSNTVRLLVADVSGSGLTAVWEEKAFVGLGAEILHRGEIGAAKLEEATEMAQRYVRIARKLGADPIEVVVTAPGRQAPNGDELVDAIARATRAPVRLLSSDEEGVLAYRGAIARADSLPETVAVCDTGGGSTEIVVGAPPDPPAWSRSVDLGSLRLTAGFLPSDPPTGPEVVAACEEAVRLLVTLTPPRPQAALVVGGSARGLARVVGSTLDEAALTGALRVATARRATKLAKAYGLAEERARVLPAGAVILREVVRRLGVPLELARGGLREGVLSELLAEAEAA
jgi:exopolyphosphatase/guanosine-5'-triphosphate,3'-diphosphate pyrophosphatase